MRSFKIVMWIFIRFYRAIVALYFSVGKPFSYSTHCCSYKESIKGWLMMLHHVGYMLGLSMLNLNSFPLFKWLCVHGICLSYSLKWSFIIICGVFNLHSTQSWRRIMVEVHIHRKSPFFNLFMQYVIVTRNNINCLYTVILLITSQRCECVLVNGSKSLNWRGKNDFAG